MSARPLASNVGDNVELTDSDVPVQVQIYRQLRAEILDGLWIGRDDFPGERDLAARFGVSVITSRNALERLAREGLVDRGRGRRSRATFVAPPDPAVEPALQFFPPDRDSKLRYELITASVDVAPAAACRAFGREPGSRLWQALRVISYRGAAQVVTHHVQLPEIGERHRKSDLRTMHMIPLLESEGVRVAKLFRQTQAAAAPPITAHHLGLAANSPALMIVVRLEDAEGETIEWMRAYGPPDRPISEEVIDLTEAR
ncbi:GntR family transcriptional regulator [Nocardia sp. NPDC052112]|uniref:GntR family transcriptional regulator n=1 Tax=Nocardia sp. NPDC052112 TaxID=3155646 RepID=UPI00344994D5